MKIIQILIVSLAVLLSFGSSHAQRGTGQEAGVAYSNADVEEVEISGVVTGKKTGPCKNSTGRSTSGTHVFVKKNDEVTYNVHLGPTGAVSEIAGKLKKGREIMVVAFRTNNHPENNYVAQKIYAGEKDFVLRDENLRPFWAGQGRNRGSSKRGGRRGGGNRW